MAAAFLAEGLNAQFEAQVEPAKICQLLSDAFDEMHVCFDHVLVPTKHDANSQGGGRRPREESPGA